MKSKTLNKSTIRAMNQELFQEYGIEPISKKSLVLVIENEDGEYIRIDGKPCFFYFDSMLIPLLKFLLEDNFLKKIEVDMGAVKFVVSGADVMRPGIVYIDEDIEKEEIVSIVDTVNKKPIAVGKTLFDSKGLREQEKGKSIESIHYIGDKLWKLK